MSDLIKTISCYPHFEELKAEVLKIIQDVNEPFPEWGKQAISLQYRDESNTEWNNSIGDYNKLNHMKPSMEQEFTQLQPWLAGSEIEKLFNSIDLKIFRARIMLMAPSVKYSTHFDPTPRVHIPIVTDEKCRFIFPDISPEYADYMPANGSVYWVNTKKMHTFVNNSDIIRIHIVAVVNDIL